MDQEIIEELRRSLKQLGQIYPVIRDYDGEILVGKHRLKAGATDIHDIDTRVLAKKAGTTPKMMKLMIKYHSNIQRRMSREEMREMVIEMAKELERQGVPKEEIASELYKKHLPHHSPQYILSLLPDEYKRKEKAVSPGRPPKESRIEMKEKPKDSYIKMQKSEPFVKLSLTEQGKEKFDIVKEKPKIPVTEEEITRRIHSPVSRMDIEVPKLLNERGVRGFRIQEPICVYQLIPDLMFPSKRVMVFLDGPGHKHSELELDMREAMRRRGWRVLEIEYESFSKSEAERIVNEILEVL